jgi:pyruvate dehydrogenase E1 component alpha subunit
LGANGIVGGSLGIATGAAFSVKKQNLDKIVICFFGDGATNQGVFYESLNIARMWNLPIIYLCENNMYAISMNIQKATGTAKLSRRVKGFDVRVKTIDGNNTLSLQMDAEVAMARSSWNVRPIEFKAILEAIISHTEQKMRCVNGSKKIQLHYIKRS